MRARTYCITRSDGGRWASVALTSTDWVVSTARGAMKVIGLVAITVPRWRAVDVSPGAGASLSSGTD